MQLTQKTIEIPCGTVSTLAWDGDELIDVTTNQRFGLDGKITGTRFFLGYPFDRGLCLRMRDALWTLAYDNRGTKAVLLKNGTVHRELNRSYYIAKDFDYPIAFTVNEGGRALVIHCPTSFDQLVFEDAETGETLLTKKSSKMEFHSRLAVSPDQTLVVSAGWFWHPVCGAWLFSPWSQQEVDEDFGFGSEMDSVAFLGNDRLLVATNDEVVNEDVPLNELGPLRLGVWSIPDKKWSSVAELAQVTGTVMPWRDWVISFYDRPKAIDLGTGAIVHRWDGIYSGRQAGTLHLGEPVPPPIALDPERGRFAVAGLHGISVILLDSVD